MTIALLKDLQRDMKSLGVYGGAIDGQWGMMSYGAFTNARRMAAKNITTPPEGMTPLLFKYCKAAAWSAKVSPLFVEKVRKIAKDLQMLPQGVDELMACMAFETGETFSPTIKNGAGAPYYGIIQFGAAAAKDAGTTLPKLLNMTAEEQLDYVYNFFKPYTGKLKTLSDIYSRIIWPVAVGKPEEYEIFVKGKGKAYIQNQGLDINKDGKITKAECSAKVLVKLIAGLHPKNLKV